MTPGTLTPEGPAIVCLDDFDRSDRSFTKLAAPGSWTLLTPFIGPYVQLKWDGVQEIVEDGVLSTGEKIPLDVIIFRAGFYLASIQYDANHRSNGI